MIHLLSCLLTFLIQICKSGIINDYAVAHDIIKSGLIQTVINDNFVGFEEFVTNIGWNADESDILFAFIQTTASPQLGPGLAFGQFERRSIIWTNDIVSTIPLEAITLSRNMELITNHGGISFHYSGIYKITVQFRTTTTSSVAWKTGRAQLIGLFKNDIVGRSVIFTTGYSNSYNGLNSPSFFVNITDVSDVYMLQLVRNGGSNFEIEIQPGAGAQDSITEANIVVLVENIGQ
eukprot:556081_1